MIDKSHTIIEAYKNSTDAKLRLASFLALQARAESYAKLSEFKKAEEDFKRLIKEAGDAKDLSKYVASAYVQLIFIQSDNDFVSAEEGLTLINQYLAKYSNNDDVLIQNILIMSIKGSLEQKIKLLDEALASFQKSKKTLTDFMALQPEQPDLDHLLHLIQLEQVSILAEKGETQAAFEQLATVRAELNGKTDDKSQELLVGATITEGYISLISAKFNWADEPTRAAYLESAVQILQDARVANETLTDLQEQQDNLATILGNEAYLVYLLEDNRALALEKLTEGFRLKGKKLYDGAVRDISLYPIEDKDDGFKEIVASAWTTVQESTKAETSN